MMEQHEVITISKQVYLDMKLSQLNQLYRDGWSFEPSKDDENIMVFWR